MLSVLINIEKFCFKIVSVWVDERAADIVQSNCICEVEDQLFVEQLRSCVFLSAEAEFRKTIVTKHELGV